MGEETSFCIGNSFSLLQLTKAEQTALDSARWVFTCNSFLSHWQAAGFRPSVWAFGDNHSLMMVEWLKLELAAYASDPQLQRRITHAFAAREQYPQEIEVLARQYDIPLIVYRRGQPWAENQPPASSLSGRIYHYGSTFSNLVNLAWLLNPGGEIRLYGNEWGDGFGHFWEGPQDRVRGQGLEFWRRVKRCMWEGLHELRYRYGLPLVDCNRHPEPLPEELRLPKGRLLEGAEWATE